MLGIVMIMILAIIGGLLGGAMAKTSKPCEDSIDVSSVMFNKATTTWLRAAPPKVPEHQSSAHHMEVDAEQPCWKIITATLRSRGLLHEPR